MPKPKLYTKVKVIKISEVQHNTLFKSDIYQINVAKFIRDAIAEKIGLSFLKIKLFLQRGVLVLFGWLN